MANADPVTTSQGTPLPYEGFGDRFAPESAQTLLDAQESPPAAASRNPGAGAPYSGNTNGTGKTTPEIDPRDTNRNGSVSFGEWRKDQGGEPLDTNGDGTVSYGEWQDAVEDSTLDTNQDGTVSFGEWLKSQNSDTGDSLGNDQPSVTATAVDGSMFD